MNCEDNTKIYDKLKDHIIMSGSYNSRISSPSGLSILDVGAHSGYWTTGLVQTGYFPNANYFLIEGNDDHKNSLRETKYPFVIALVCDIDDKEVSYHKAEASRFGSTGNSIYREQTVYFEASKHESRYCYTIDSILDIGGYGDTSFDIIKFDIQGSEYDALIGAIKTIARSDPIIITEVSILPYNGPDAASLLDISIVMAEYGFHILDIGDTHQVTHTSSSGIGNEERKVSFDTTLQLDVLWARREHVVFSQSSNTRSLWSEKMKWDCKRITPY